MKLYIALAVIAASVANGYAQTPPPPARSAPTLNLLRHNPETQGVLLFIANGSELRSLMPLQRVVPKKADTPENTDAPTELATPIRTPAQFAADTKRHVAISGNLSAIVPRTMAVLARNPPPANPYSDMAFDDGFLVMLGKFSRAQWAQAASENGIGLSDMTPEQREIYAGLWGEEGATVTTDRSPPFEEGQQYRAPVRVKEEKFGANEIRFRFSRRVSLIFEETTRKQDYIPETLFYGATVEPEADGSTVRQNFLQPGGDQRFTAGEETKSYGVTLMRSVPNTLKPGDLGLDSPAFAVGVVLDGSQKNVGDLLAAVSKASRIELRADKRLASLSVLMKTMPGGQSVKAGDLLKLICRSVTGTFRHLRGADASDRGVYLLTDDREGIGTRLALLDKWAEDVYEKRQKLIEDAPDACAENEPLDLLGFMPGDKYALSPDIIKAEDDIRREKGSGGEGLKISPTKLSSALREEIEKQHRWYSETSPKLNFRTDQVKVITEFHCDWVLPGKRVFPARFSAMLDEIGVPKAKRPKTYTDGEKHDHPEPTGFPANLKRRVLVAPLPEDAAVTLALMQSARAKGFSEIWLGVESEGEETRTRLQSAVATGKTVALSVGAVLPWTFKKPEGESTAAVEDLNILGETGAQTWARQERRMETLDETDPVRREYQQATRREQKSQTAGWIIPDAALAARRIAPFLALPGLSGVVLENTAPPGYTGERYTDETAMGYTDATRLGCVRATSIDPVDIVRHGYEMDYVLMSRPYLPFFSEPDSSMDLVATFRLARNKAFMASLWEALRPQQTGTPIYLDNRTIDASYPFYARWSDPKKVPTVAEIAYGEATTRTAAFKASTEPLLSSQGTPPPNSAASFWDKWYKNTRLAATGWRGFVVDLRYQSPEQIAGFLKQLPDDTAPRKEGK